jgi:hypothetical protein
MRVWILHIVRWADERMIGLHLREQDMCDATKMS